jgi:hypothetical protein
MMWLCAAGGRGPSLLWRRLIDVTSTREGVSG